MNLGHQWGHANSCLVRSRTVGCPCAPNFSVTSTSFSAQDTCSPVCALSANLNIISWWCARPQPAVSQFLLWVFSSWRQRASHRDNDQFDNSNECSKGGGQVRNYLKGKGKQNKKNTFWKDHHLALSYSTETMNSRHPCLHPV